ncbi:MAG TPA: hypothetical protein VFQ87_04795, partial [Bradyrhizobium sp.]|nr:hypothetical protein [Bradyrhizobium sp.]
DRQNEPAGQQGVFRNLKGGRRFQLVFFRTRRKSFGAPVVSVDDNLHARQQRCLTRHEIARSPPTHDGMTT